MTDFKPGDIAVVPFPFTDLQTVKKRPALVLTKVSSRSFPDLVVVAMITSQLEGEAITGDYTVAKWKEAGLLHPSKVRLAKVVSLETTLLLNKLGSLQKEDHAGVKKELKKVFAEWG